MKGWRQTMSQSQPKQTELQKLQQEYAHKAGIYGDIMYRINCFQQDAEKLVQDMREINQKATELNLKPAPKLEDLPQMTEQEMASPNSEPKAEAVQ